MHKHGGIIFDLNFMRLACQQKILPSLPRPILSVIRPCQEEIPPAFQGGQVYWGDGDGRSPSQCQVTCDSCAARSSSNLRWHFEHGPKGTWPQRSRGLVTVFHSVPTSSISLLHKRHMSTAAYITTKWWCAVLTPTGGEQERSIYSLCLYGPVLSNRLQNPKRWRG